MDQETEYETEIKSHEIAEEVFFGGEGAAINFSTNRKREKHKFLWNIFVSEVSEIIFANSNIMQFRTNCKD